MGRFAPALEKLSAASPEQIKPARAELFRGFALQGLGKTAEAQQHFARRPPLIRSRSMRRSASSIRWRRRAMRQAHWRWQRS